MLRSPGLPILLVLTLLASSFYPGSMWVLSSLPVGWRPCNTPWGHKLCWVGYRINISLSSIYGPHGIRDVLRDHQQCVLGTWSGLKHSDTSMKGVKQGEWRSCIFDMCYLPTFVIFYFIVFLFFSVLYSFFKKCSRLSRCQRILESCRCLLCIHGLLSVVEVEVPVLFCNLTPRRAWPWIVV